MLSSNTETLISQTCLMMFHSNYPCVVTGTRLNITEQEIMDVNRNFRLHPLFLYALFIFKQVRRTCCLSMYDILIVTVLYSLFLVEKHNLTHLMVMCREVKHPSVNCDVFVLLACISLTVTMSTYLYCYIPSPRP